MNRQDQHGNFPETSSADTGGRSHQKRQPLSQGKAQAEKPQDWQVLPDTQEGDRLSTDQASFAYQLLLLQQRLAAYEQLHLEEIADLRQEIEQLRRAFLQETHPQLRAIASARDKE